MITKDAIDRLEFHTREAAAYETKPRTRPEPYLHETILALIAEWRARQPDEPQEHVCIHCNRDKSWHQGADQKCYYGNGKTTFEVDSACTHCRKPKSAHHGEDLRCHLGAFHGVNTFQAEPVKEPVCKHCGYTKGAHLMVSQRCFPGSDEFFEPLSQ